MWNIFKFLIEQFKVLTGESTAEAGTHFTLPSGIGTIPANSSFGLIRIDLVNTGVSSSTPKDLVLQLTDNSSIRASKNYAKVGLRISQL